MKILKAWAISPAKKFLIEGMCVEQDEAAFDELRLPPVSWFERHVIRVAVTVQILNERNGSNEVTMFTQMVANIVEQVWQIAFGNVL